MTGGYEDGCHLAVYATDNINVAIGFALGGVSNQDGELERMMEPTLGNEMVFFKGTPKIEGTG